jgi:transcription antitermination factor NusG
MTSHWYALLVRSQSELSTAVDLRAEGVTVFVPTETVRVFPRISRRKAPPRDVIRPLVTGYVFADYPRVEHKQVRGVIMVDETPYRIPHAHMLPLFHAAGRVREIDAPHQEFTIGSIVRLTGTPFDSQAVTVATYHDGRYTVTGRLFGRPVEIPVSREQIAA